MRTLFISLTLLLSHCAKVGVSAGVRIPRDSAETCGSYCKDLGLHLDSLVIMADNVGCVCSVRATTASAGAASSAGGMTAILLEEAAKKKK